MWALGGVVISPLSDFVAGMSQGLDPMRIQALVPELAVETLHEGVLHRLAKLNKPQAHSGTPVRSDQSNIALLVPSGRLSRMNSSVRPTCKARSSRNQATRAPGIDTSTNWPGQNRL